MRRCCAQRTTCRTDTEREGTVFTEEEADALLRQAFPWGATVERPGLSARRGLLPRVGCDNGRTKAKIAQRCELSAHVPQ